MSEPTCAQRRQLDRLGLIYDRLEVATVGDALIITAQKVHKGTSYAVATLRVDPDGNVTKA